GRPELLLPADGRAGGLRPAVGAEGAEPERAAVGLLERRGRHPHRHRRPVPLPPAPARARPDAGDAPAARLGGGDRMNYFVADPDWGFWIISYFYLGGIAAGSYFLAVLIEWFGTEEDRPLARIAYLLAFPLIVLCAVCLIVDLERPERFWHMMLKSET